MNLVRLCYPWKMIAMGEAAARGLRNACCLDSPLQASVEESTVVFLKVGYNCNGYHTKSFEFLVIRFVNDTFVLSFHKKPLCKTVGTTILD